MLGVGDTLSSGPPRCGVLVGMKTLKTRSWSGCGGCCRGCGAPQKMTTKLIGAHRKSPGASSHQKMKTRSSFLVSRVS